MASTPIASGGQEKVPVQLVDGRGGVGYHGRRARDSAQQRDLAYPFATAETAQRLPLLDGVELTRGDRIVGISRITLLDQHGPGVQLYRP